jgi:AcrR family transcriptional regulator
MEQGYHATSVREIGEQLQLSQSSLYHHAKNKPQILVDLNDEFMSDLLEAMEEILERDAGALEKLEAVLNQLLRSIADHQAVVTVVLHERRSLPPRAAKKIQRQRDRVDAIIDEILREGIAEGSIREVQVPLVRLGLTGMCNWAYTWYDARGSLSAEEIARTFMDVLAHGIAAAD